MVKSQLCLPWTFLVSVYLGCMHRSYRYCIGCISSRWDAVRCLSLPLCRNPTGLTLDACSNSSVIFVFPSISRGNGPLLNLGSTTDFAAASSQACPKSFREPVDDLFLWNGSCSKAFVTGRLHAGGQGRFCWIIYTFDSKFPKLFIWYLIIAGKTK